MGSAWDRLLVSSLGSALDGLIVSSLTPYNTRNGYQN
jgi:hypothetical protein